MKITLQMLQQQHACADQIALFQGQFGAAVEITEGQCLAVAALFDWDWAARQFLPAPALADYRKATAAAWADYRKATAAAWADHGKATAASWADYDKATAPAQADYGKARAAAFGRIAGAL
jgi:hypothetical protein